MQKFKIKFSDNFFSNLRGLMFSKPLKKNHAILLKVNSNSRLSSAIHTCFVFFAIDVIWLDEKFNVVDIRRDIKPFTLLVVPRKRARFILEARAGEFKDVKINRKLPTDLKRSLALLKIWG